MKKHWKNERHRRYYVSNREKILQWEKERYRRLHPPKPRKPKPKRIPRPKRKKVPMVRIQVPKKLLGRLRQLKQNKWETHGELIERMIKKKGFRVNLGGSTNETQSKPKLIDKK